MQVLVVFVVNNTQQDEVAHGKLNCKPNAKNKRDLDITIDYTFHGGSQNLENIYSEYKMYFTPPLYHSFFLINAKGRRY
jgi:hypothetical protein